MWHNVHGHDDVVEQFCRALGRGRLASSFLFTGPSGIGKRTFALKFAQTLLCSTRPEGAMDPCEACPSCMQVAAGSHPDLDVVEKPEGRASIPLELLVGDVEHRRREGLCHNIAMKPCLGRRKVAVIDDADDLNAEGANALLKTLEEPPPRSVLILIGTTPAKQLPTIRSRCQLVRFRPLALDTIEELLLSKSLVQDRDEAGRLAQHSEGSLQRAMELSDPALWTFRRALHERLAEPRLDAAGLAQATAGFVEEAGKEASARRARLRQIVAFAADFYRGLLLAQCNATTAVDEDVKSHIQQVLRRGHDEYSATAARLDRCLTAAAEIDRNANQATLIECWADDLCKATDGR